MTSNQFQVLGHVQPGDELETVRIIGRVLGIWPDLH